MSPALILTPMLSLALQASPITAEDLGWMSGYWLSCENGREVSETWTDPRGDLMLGSAVTLEGGRLTTFESSRISPVGPAGSGVAYHAGVNGAPPVVFPAVEASEGRVVFENRDHDFPQRVVYRREGDMLHARIEGHMGDREQAYEWTYRKAELNARCRA